MKTIILAGIALIFLGAILLTIGILKASITTGGEVKGGGVVMIGPIPIIFGTEPKYAILAAILALALMFTAYWLTRKF